jgi:hypothetical protein
MGGPRDYLVVYQRQVAPGTFDLIGAIYNGTGFVAGDNITTQEDDGLEGLSQIDASTDTDGCAYAVAYSEEFAGADYDTYAITVSRRGSALQVKERHAILDFSVNHDDFPQVTGLYDSAGTHVASRHGIAWRSGDDIRGGLYDIRGFVSFCHPGDPANGGSQGTMPCPCGNPPTASGRGCNNFGAGPAASGLLTAAGTASLSGDTIVFTAAGENNTPLTLFLQGTEPIFGGLPFAAGVRCIGGTLKRLYNGIAAGGTITRPLGSDPRVHVRSAALGDPIGPCESRYYMAYYRDPLAAGPCGSTNSTFNSTQSGSLLWYP